jgi:hypothetical protein
MLVLVGLALMVVLGLSSMMVMAFAPLQQLLLHDLTGNRGGMIENHPAAIIGCGEENPEPAER